MFFTYFLHPKITSIMAKNKKKQTKQQFLSPTEYIAGFLTNCRIEI